MSKNTIYVTGHKNPDTDSIVSAMAYAYFKQQMGYDALAVRLGNLNQETEFVLQRYNEFAPPLASDIKPCVRDVEFDQVYTCSLDDDLKKVIKTMDDHKVKVVAVVDEQQNILGTVSHSDITNPAVNYDKHARLIKRIEYQRMADYLKGDLVYKANRENNGELYICGSVSDNECKDRITITSDDERLQKAAIEYGSAVLIATNCKEVSDSVIQLCKEKEVTLITCNKDMFLVTKEIYMSAPVSMLMTSNVICVKLKDKLEDVKQVVNKSRYRSYPILDERNHVVGMISRYHVLKQMARDIILVDHNETSQSIDGIESANIIEIVDHHRIGGVKTASPISFRNEAVGCCSTIITKIFRENNVEIPPELAGMLCCAIISDTVNFKSVTCTQTDIDIANYLAKIANENIDELGPAILAAGASLTNKTIDEIFHGDLKRFAIGNINVAVSQTNAVSFESIVSLREQMNKELSEFTRDSGVNIVLMAFTLIDGSGSYVLVQGNEVRKISDALKRNGISVDGFVFLPNLISRKLQIIPMITEAINETR